MRIQSFLFLGSLSLAGCAVGPDFEPPSPPDIESYTENHLLFQALGGGWWNRTCKTDLKPEERGDVDKLG